MSMYLSLPSTCGYSVDVETDEISRINGRRIWRTVLLTPNKKRAEDKQLELESDGYHVRVLECIY